MLYHTMPFNLIILINEPFKMAFRLILIDFDKIIVYKN